MENKTLMVIQKTREYLDYIEIHIKNVIKAWELVQEKCKDLNIIYDDNLFWLVQGSINTHDISKLDWAEFIPYRMKFFPTEWESPENWDGAFKKAWDHHLAVNDHHWQNWTKKIKEYHPQDPHVVEFVVHNAVDWIAMGFEFEDNARDYYEKNKHKIEIPKWAESLMYDIFDRVYGSASN